MQIDVCLEMVFTDLPYTERVARIAACGYQQVEFWLQEEKDAATLKQVCAMHGVTINNLVANVPDGSIGGAPVAEGDRTRYLERMEKVIAFAQACGCRKAITCSGNLQKGATRSRMRKNLERALGEATEIAARHQFTLLLEPLNTHVDHAGYFLDSSSEAAALVRAIDSPHLRLLYDVYHMQIMEGNLIATIEKNLDIIGHFHSAGVPGRHELFQGELNYPEILRRIQAGGYTGSFGLEYAPAMKDHSESLRQTLKYLTA